MVQWRRLVKKSFSHVYGARLVHTFCEKIQDMNTDLEALYKDIVKELQNEKELNVGKEHSESKVETFIS
jgi:hypothetical protein